MSSSRACSCGISCGRAPRRRLAAVRAGRAGGWSPAGCLRAAWPRAGPFGAPADPGWAGTAPTQFSRRPAVARPSCGRGALPRSNRRASGPAPENRQPRDSARLTGPRLWPGPLPPPPARRGGRRMGGMDPVSQSRLVRWAIVAPVGQHHVGVPGGRGADHAVVRMLPGPCLVRVDAGRACGWARSRPEDHGSGRWSRCRWCPGPRSPRGAAGPRRRRPLTSARPAAICRSTCASM